MKRAPIQRSVLARLISALSNSTRVSRASPGRRAASRAGPARCPSRQRPLPRPPASRQVQPRLRPMRTPRGSRAGDRARRRRTGRDPIRIFVDLLQRADPGQPPGEALGLHQRPVRRSAATAIWSTTSRTPPPSQATGLRRALNASSTAEVTCSRWRWAMTGCPYRAKMTSPCSVILGQQPGTWAAPHHPGPGRRPARAPPPAVEDGQPHIAPGGPGRQLGLGVGQRRRRTDHLGRVGVAEHDLQPPPPDGGFRATTGSSPISSSRLAALCRSFCGFRTATTSSTGGSPRRVASRASRYTAPTSAADRVKPLPSVPVAGVHAEPGLDPAHRPAGWRGSRRSARTPPRRPRSRAARGRARRCAGPAERVEAERLRLPDQVLQLAERLADGTRQGRPARAAGRPGNCGQPGVGQVGLARAGRAAVPPGRAGTSGMAPAVSARPGPPAARGGPSRRPRGRA